MPEGHRDVLGADDDFRNLFYITVHAHVNDDPTVDAILAALDASLNHAYFIQRLVKIKESRRLPFHLSVTRDPELSAVIVPHGKACGGHGKGDDIVLDGHFSLFSFELAGLGAEVAHENGLAADSMNHKR